MRRVSILFFLLLILLSWKSQAQDREFSQFYAAPVILNPALTGAFDGRYRISLLYRDQWRNLLEDRSPHYSAGVDFRFPIKYRNGRTQDGVGAGFFFTRQNNPNNFGITQFNLSGAYHKSLNQKNNQFLTLGFGLGLSQRSISYEDLTFEDQFDGLNGYNNPTGEELPPNNLAYSDLSVGLHYSFAPASNKGLFLGVALQHVNQPQVSFFFDEEADFSPGDDKLNMKIVGHIGGILPLGDQIQLHPRAVYFQQGNHWTFNAGANFRFPFNSYQDNALHLGAWARPVRDSFNPIELDSAVALLGLEFNSFLMGFSYDFPLSAFSRDQVGSGALEFSIRYVGKIEGDNIFCPQF